MYEVSFLYKLTMCLFINRMSASNIVKEHRSASVQPAAAAAPPATPRTTPPVACVFVQPLLRPEPGLARDSV